MVPPVLRIVFDRNDAGVRPIPAVADGCNDFSECEVVVGYLRFGFWGAITCAAGMIVREPENRQIGPRIVLLAAMKIRVELRRPKNVGNCQVEPQIIRLKIWRKKGEVGLGCVDHAVGLMDEILIIIHPPRGFMRAFPIMVAGHVFTEVQKRFAVIDASFQMKPDDE